jgi:hypothetical protein
MDASRSEQRPPEQKVRFGQVRRDVDRVVQFDNRLAVVLLLKQPLGASR